MGAKSKATRFWWCFSIGFSWWHTISEWRKTTKTQGHVVMAMVVAFHESWWNRIIGKLWFLEDWDVAILFISLVEWGCFNLYPTLPKTSSEFAPENRPFKTPKGKVCLPTIRFRCELLVSGRILFHSRFWVLVMPRCLTCMSIMFVPLWISSQTLYWEGDCNVFCL